MQIQFFNSLTRKKEIFKPLVEGQVSMYTCGPTVYHYVHIGNLRTFIFEDVLRRALEYFGYKVTQVMNLTDVDDKTIKGAIQEKISLNEFTQKYKNAFFADLKTLNIQPAAHYPAATDYIPQMIQMIEVLLEKGFAYRGQDGSIYYQISKFSHYGCLSHLKLDELKAGASERVAQDEYEKENIADFVLWKAYDSERDGGIYWESPFGKGRPGWHLECSAMATALLGETIDLHMGGIDNLFPHHENEIAQSEACTDRKFVNYWMHAEHLIVDGKKMSKSLGNFFTLRDLLTKGYSGPVIRLMLLHTHYKTQLNFTLDGLDSMKNALERLHDFVYRLQHYQEVESSGQASALIENLTQEFAKGLSDDLNISHSLGALFDFVRELNVLMDQKKISQQEAFQILEILKSLNQVLGVLDFQQNSKEIPEEVQNLFDQRLQARSDKNWALADTLRLQISDAGYIIEDSPTGARLKRK